MKKAEDEKFNEFWRIYPKRVAKKSAQRAWAKIKDPDLERIVKGIENWMTTQQWQDPERIPYPATFLNGERWEDEIPAGKMKIQEARIGVGPSGLGSVKPEALERIRQRESRQ